MQLILLIIIVTISSVIFAIMFKILNKSFGLFLSVQVYTNKLKRKTLWKIFSGVVLLLIGIAIVKLLNLGIYSFGITLSFTTSLNEILFENTLEKSQKVSFQNKTK